eukprot:TRINITY_DN46546_c0_g1_i1.p1 TRINITY_DN46546_c0_g1~~TRINITY_DN46546_c0_g1_i1.p1  ORF type:complete len:183 (+),score=36.05 TRINITY_DN46546_c0_g1_i1:407-955(+)
MAKALIEALEGKKTIPISKIAARLNLSEKQTKYLQQLKDDSAASMDVTVSRAYSLEYTQTNKFGRPASKGPKPEKMITRVSKVTLERQRRREAQQHSSMQHTTTTTVGDDGNELNIAADDEVDRDVSIGGHDGSTTVAVTPSATPGVSNTTTTVSYTHLRAHETPEHLVCRLLLEKKKKPKK